jgi:hypothetical protein
MNVERELKEFNRLWDSDVIHKYILDLKWQIDFFKSRDKSLYLSCVDHMSAIYLAERIASRYASDIEKIVNYNGILCVSVRDESTVGCLHPDIIIKLFK